MYKITLICLIVLITIAHSKSESLDTSEIENVEHSFSGDEGYLLCLKESELKPPKYSNSLRNELHF